MINPKTLASEGFRSVSPAPEMRIQWSVPADLPYFAGHFPGNPTLPAVAMIDLSLELVRQWPGFERAELSILKSAKFSAVVTPGAEVEVLLTREVIPSGIEEWRAEWTLAGAAAASFRFRTSP
jgi:3-hydroxymyristoyl/3-hydroxydecanoyl-(acyl carrier protein) dehydratase